MDKVLYILAGNLSIATFISIVLLEAPLVSAKLSMQQAKVIVNGNALPPLEVVALPLFTRIRKEWNS